MIGKRTWRAILLTQSLPWKLQAGSAGRRHLARRRVRFDWHGLGASVLNEDGHNVSQSVQYLIEVTEHGLKELIDAVLPRVMEEILEVVKLVPQPLEPVQKCVMEQNAHATFPQILDQIVDDLKVIHPSKALATAHSGEDRGCAHVAGVQRKLQKLRKSFTKSVFLSELATTRNLCSSKMLMTNAMRSVRRRRNSRRRRPWACILRVGGKSTQSSV